MTTGYYGQPLLREAGGGPERDGAVQGPARQLRPPRPTSVRSKGPPSLLDVAAFNPAPQPRDRPAAQELDGAHGLLIGLALADRRQGGAVRAEPDVAHALCQCAIEDTRRLIQAGRCPSSSAACSM